MQDGSGGCSILATLVVPVRDEDSGVVESIVHGTFTMFRGSVDIQVVDDGSKIPCPTATLRHEVSKGYGAAIKTGISHSKSEWIVTMDGDGQHRLRDVQRLIEFIGDFPELDMVIGDRRLHESSFTRLAGRKFLNWTATVFANRWINDLNSGIRIFRRDIAVSYYPILSNGFSFTTSLTMAMLADRHKVDWIPVNVLDRKNGCTKVRLIRDGLHTLMKIVVIGGALRTRSLRAFLRKSRLYMYLKRLVGL